MASKIRGGSFHQSAGVRHTAKSRLTYGIDMHHADCRCDFCEKRISAKLAHQTGAGLTLCPDCLGYMETLPQGAEEMLERFLMGNVV